MTYSIHEILETFDKKPQNEKQVRAFLNTVSPYKLKPYLDFVAKNPQIIDELTFLPQNNLIKDEWDAAIELYRYNTKLSVTVYPYIFILETSLKTRINKFLKEKYGPEWYKNDALFFEMIGFDDFDIELFYKYRHYRSLSFYKSEIAAQYKQKEPALSSNKVTQKINKLKFSMLILNEIEDYCFKYKDKADVDHFTESTPSFNFWITILQLRNLWFSSDRKEFYLPEVFINIPKEPLKNEEIYKDILRKCDNIRFLRNCIAHYRQIIGRNIFQSCGKNLTLIEIYYNIIKLFDLLGCNVYQMLDELHCTPSTMCGSNAFLSIYEQYAFVHHSIIDQGPEETPENQLF